MFTAFLIASLVLAITPGPAVIYLLTRTLADGRRAGFASLAGIALGNFGNAFGASVGLAALFAISSVAFTIVKVAGALYLVYLGIRALRPVKAPDNAVPQRPPGAWPVFRDGFVVALFNPKTALFFAAFLPQFIDPATSPMLQSVLLGTVFVVVAATTDSIYVLAASRVMPALFRPALGGAKPGAAQAGGWPQRCGRYLSASAFIGLGIFTALSGPRAGK